MNKTLRVWTALSILGLLGSRAVAGQIQGVVSELDERNTLPGVTITVFNLLNNGQVVGQPATSDRGGAFTVSLPDGVPVSVTFVDNTHLDAALIGISGSATLANFKVFMPVKTAVGCRANSYCCRCRRRCR
jgi:hypothetical protein